ncbi:MAG: sigma-54 dependent transcriptional regulator [Candidatus Tantalella remota]|nr:sigma-54 dependent transcriptional regulator [Candidatus Tantalella remota]
MSKDKIILIVDDEKEICEVFKKLIERMVEERVVCANTGEEAEKLIRGNKLMLVMLDYKLPDTTGIELLKKIKAIDSDVPVVMLTGYGTVEFGVEAIKQGAYDYFLKPVLPEKIHALVRGLVSKRKLMEENLVLREELGIKYSAGRLIGKSEKIGRIYDQLSSLAQTDSTVLIQGESGTGKELMARAIHQNSYRSERPFIIADCTSMTDSLLESELFGHERGAFTGAIRRKIGRLEQADGGTIFLDEIGDFSPMAQLKLLRVLQERSFERVGGEETIEVDVRIVAATNRDLEKLVAEGKFREDLFYRLNVIPVALPPLRERKEDIPDLAKEFLGRFSRKNNKNISRISEDAYRSLLDHNWPGNIRELENTMERVVVIAKGNVVTDEDLPGKIRERTGKDHASNGSLQDNEKKLVIGTLNETGYNLSKAARNLGISRSTLYGKMRKFGIKGK